MQSLQDYFKVSLLVLMLYNVNADLEKTSFQLENDFKKLELVFKNGRQPEIRY